MTINKIENAMGELTVHLWLKLNKKPVERPTQLVMSLEVYLERGEYDGTLNSALVCLQQAGYELTEE